MFALKYSSISQMQEKKYKECAIPLQYLAEPLTWNEEIHMKFQNKLVESTTTSNINELNEDIDKININVAAEKVAMLLNVIANECGSGHLGKNIIHHSAPTKDKTRIFPFNKWLDDDCKEQKRVFNAAKQTFSCKTNG